MKKSDQRIRYLEAYRQQIRSELDDMGYGKPREYVADFESQTQIHSTSKWPILAFTFAFMSSR